VDGDNRDCRVEVVGQCVVKLGEVLGLLHERGVSGLLQAHHHKPTRQEPVEVEGQAVAQNTATTWDNLTTSVAFRPLVAADLLLLRMPSCAREI